MRRLFVLTAFVVWGSAASAQTAPLSDVSLVDGRLTYCGLSLGDPAEPPGDDFRGPGGDVDSRTLCGRTVSIGVRTDPDGTSFVGLIWIPRRDEDSAAQWDLGTMQATMRAGLPTPTYFEGPYEVGVAEADDTSPQYRVAGAEGQLIVLKPEEAIYMEYGDGWD